MKKSMKMNTKSYITTYYLLFSFVQRMREAGLINSKIAIIAFLMLSRSVCEANGIKTKEAMNSEFKDAFNEIVKNYAEAHDLEVDEILNGSAFFGANASIHANILQSSRGKLKLPKKVRFYEELFKHMLYLNPDDEMVHKIVRDCDGALDVFVSEEF